MSSFEEAGKRLEKVEAQQRVEERARKLASINERIEHAADMAAFQERRGGDSFFEKRDLDSLLVERERLDATS